METCWKGFKIITVPRLLLRHNYFLKITAMGRTILKYIYSWSVVHTFNIRWISTLDRRVTAVVNAIIANIALISPNIAKYRQISPNIAKYRQISPNIAEYRRISPNIAKYRQISPNIAKYRQISPNIAKYRLISPNIAKYRQISPNIASALTSKTNFQVTTAVTRLYGNYDKLMVIKTNKGTIKSH